MSQVKETKPNKASLNILYFSKKQNYCFQFNFSLAFEPGEIHLIMIWFNKLDFYPR